MSPTHFGSIKSFPPNLPRKNGDSWGLAVSGVTHMFSVLIHSLSLMGSVSNPGPSLLDSLFLHGDFCTHTHAGKCLPTCSGSWGVICSVY